MPGTTWKPSFKRARSARPRLPYPKQLPGQRQRGTKDRLSDDHPRDIYPASTRGGRAKRYPSPARTGRRITKNGGTDSEDPRSKRTCAQAQVPRQAIFSLGPSTAQPLAALPLTDAAYPLRVRPVLFLPPCKKRMGGGLGQAAIAAGFLVQWNGFRK